MRYWSILSVRRATLLGPANFSAIQPSTISRFLLRPNQYHLDSPNQLINQSINRFLLRPNQYISVSTTHSIGSYSDQTNLLKIPPLNESINRFLLRPNQYPLDSSTQLINSLRWMTPCPSRVEYLDWFVDLLSYVTFINRSILD